MLSHNPQAVIDALYADKPDRATIMVALYGEVCTMAQAGQILGRSAGTVRNMVEDGRLEAACAGTRVDVRSIARYIEAPADRDYEARVRKRREKADIECQWYV